MRNKKTGTFKRILLLLMIMGILLVMPACSSKETVLLKSEDLVLHEGYLEGTEEEQKEEQVEESTLFVHICGEVEHPGVYELPLGSRIYEVVEAAGGFTSEAEESYVNLAQVLEDGWKVEIPAIGMQGNAEQGINSADEDGLVDINTAAKKELCSLPGIGESRAESIIAYRENNGGFSRIEDIMKVEGIKEGMFEKIKDKICVRGVK